MANEGHVPLHELIPYDENLPTEVKDTSVSLLTSALLRTVWGWRRAARFSMAQAEYYNSITNVAESIHRFNESVHRLGTVKERVARDAELERLQDEARKIDLEYQIKKKRLAMERLDTEHQVETKQLDEQLSALQKKQASSQNKKKSGDGLNKKERDAYEAVNRYVAGLTKIKPKLDETDRILDEMITQGTITQEAADEAKDEIQGIISDGFLRLE
jgi:hypothetical protein